MLPFLGRRYLGTPLDQDDAAVRSLQHMHAELSKKECRYLFFHDRGN